MVKKKISDINENGEFSLENGENPAEYLRIMNAAKALAKLSNGNPMSESVRRALEQSYNIERMPGHTPPPPIPLSNPKSKGGSLPHSVSFIKNNKIYTRRVYTVKNKKYIKFENKDIPIAKLKLTN